MKIEKIKLDLIQPYWRNPRINQQTVDVLIKSITEYGFNLPITIDKDNVIITGHTRYKACSNLRNKLDERIKQLIEQGKTQLSENLQAINDGYAFIIRLTDLTPEQVKKFRIDDNKIGELSKWDNDVLKSEIRTLESALIGFTNKELDKILAEVKDFEEYTDIDIEKATLELDTHFPDMVKKKEEQQVTLICPYCHEEFSIDINDTKSFIKWKKINAV